MHNQQNKGIRRGAIVFGFPGVGKTTTALSSSGVIDLDFGMFRSAWKVSKDNEYTLFAPFSRLLLEYYKQGYIVLTNEPALIPHVKQGAEGHLLMVLPTDPRYHVERIRLRAADKANKAIHHNSFANQMAEMIEAWLESWSAMAERYKVPILMRRNLDKEVLNAIR